MAEITIVKRKKDKGRRSGKDANRKSEGGKLKK